MALAIPDLNEWKIPIDYSAEQKFIKKIQAAQYQRLQKFIWESLCILSFA